MQEVAFTVCVSWTNVLTTKSEIVANATVEITLVRIEWTISIWANERSQLLLVIGLNKIPKERFKC